MGSQTQSLEVNEENEVYIVEKSISLEDYLINFGVIECLKLHKIMQQADLRFRSVISLLLRRHKANSGDASEFVRSISEETEI